MKIKTVLFLLAAIFCMVACSEEENAPVLPDMTGDYAGYTVASCAYFQNRYTDGESVKLTSNEDGTVAVGFESASWGNFYVTSATVLQENGEYTFSGSGSVTMGMGESISNYDFTVTGTTNAAKDSYSITFSVPSVMGGLTITLLPGNAPATND